jgi:hypothetical protein
LAFFALNPALAVFVLDHESRRLTAIYVVYTFNDRVAMVIVSTGDAIATVGQRLNTGVLRH